MKALFSLLLVFGFFTETKSFLSALDRIFPDKKLVTDGYTAVRGGGNDDWCLLTYIGKEIHFKKMGHGFDKLENELTDDIRAYVYYNIVGSGGEQRYALIAWVGESVYPLKKAKFSTDKAFLKELWPKFSKEFLCETPGELNLARITRQCIIAPEQPYGTGI